MLDEYPDVLNTKEVMEILDITKNLLYKLIHTKQLPAYRIGQKKWRINKNSLIDEELNLLVKAGGTLLIAAIKRKEI